MSWIDPDADNITCDKSTYPDLTTARKAAKGVAKKSSNSIRPYLCSECGKYHLASAGKSAHRKFAGMKRNKNPEFGVTVKVKIKDKGDAKKTQYPIRIKY